jgi:hypothetical protein
MFANGMVASSRMLFEGTEAMLTGSNKVECVDQLAEVGEGRWECSFDDRGLSDRYACSLSDAASCPGSNWMGCSGFIHMKDSGAHALPVLCALLPLTAVLVAQPKSSGRRL